MEFYFLQNYAALLFNSTHFFFHPQIHYKEVWSRPQRWEQPRRRRTQPANPFPLRCVSASRRPRSQSPAPRAGPWRPGTPSRTCLAPPNPTDALRKPKRQLRKKLKKREVHGARTKDGCVFRTRNPKGILKRERSSQCKMGVKTNLTRVRSKRTHTGNLVPNNMPEI